MATKTQGQSGAAIQPVVKVVSMDHIAMRVSDVDASLHFYHEILGMPTDRLEEYREGKVPFPSVRINEGTVIDFFAWEGQPSTAIPTRNLDHYCIMVEDTDLAAVAERLKELGVRMGPASPFKPEEVGGPYSPRYGARGNGTSLYIFDPDENIVELRVY